MGQGEKMEHPIHWVTAFEVVGPYTLLIEFEDHSRQTIYFRGVLEGGLYGPLQDVALFNRVQIDPEVHTLVWPNGADFDPATLYDWQKYGDTLKALAKRWAGAATT